MTAVLEPPESPANPPAEVMICPHCLEGNDPTAHFCRYCVTPLTAHAATDPLKSIYAEMDTLAKGAASPRSLVVVLGMILLLGPWLAGAVGVAIALLAHTDGPGMSGVLLGVVGITFRVPIAAVLFFVPVILLYRMIKHFHVEAPATAGEEPLPEGWEANEWEVNGEGSEGTPT